MVVCILLCVSIFPTVVFISFHFISTALHNTHGSNAILSIFYNKKSPFWGEYSAQTCVRSYNMMRILMKFYPSFAKSLVVHLKLSFTSAMQLNKKSVKQMTSNQNEKWKKGSTRKGTPGMIVKEDAKTNTSLLQLFRKSSFDDWVHTQREWKWKWKCEKYAK